MKMFPREKQFADYLNSQNKAWVYQPKRFKLKNTTYRADFYCPQDNIFYEVVGTRQALSALKDKLKEFIRTYPDIKFKVVKPNGEDYYFKNGKGYSFQEVWVNKYGKINDIKKIKEYIPFPKNPCRRCIYDCKQNKYAKVIYCPQREAIS